jgi:hypothetical protein
MKKAIENGNTCMILLIGGFWTVTIFLTAIALKY